MCCLRNPAKGNIFFHLDIVGNSLDSYMSSYENFFIAGYLDPEITEMAMVVLNKTIN